MSTFKLKVRFGGVCAFAPEDDRLWVFLIDERQPMAGLQAHSPVVLFNLADLEGPEPENGPPNTVQGLWNLAGYDLKIDPGEGREGLRIEGLQRGEALTIPSLQGPDQETSFAWVASVEEACASRGFPGGGKIKPELIDPNGIPAGARNGIAARICLTRGTVKAGPLAKFGNSKIVWRFRPFEGEARPNDHRQYVASTVEWEVDVTSPSVNIQATKFDGSNPMKLALRPATFPTAKVDLLILNEENGVILGNGSPPLLQPNVPRPDDRIFASVRKILQDPPPLEEFPIPVSETLNPAPISPVISLSAPPCSPLRVRV